MNDELQRESRIKAFVRFVMNCVKEDKGAAARFRRADNPSTESQCWEYLAAFGVDLTSAEARTAYAVVAAAIVKAKVTKNGTVKIGQALARCYEKGANSDQAKAKLRRLLACESVEELCSILRPLLQLIDAKSECSLDFASLLNDVHYFHKDQDDIKARWAKNFYHVSSQPEVKFYAC